MPAKLSKVQRLESQQIVLDFYSLRMYGVGRV